MAVDEESKDILVESLGVVTLLLEDNTQEGNVDDLRKTWTKSSKGRGHRVRRPSSSVRVEALAPGIGTIKYPKIPRCTSL